MKDWNHMERRKFLRLNYPCLIVIEGVDGIDNILTHTENIGLGGFSIILKQQIKENTIVQLEIDLLDMEEHVKCAGNIVWQVKRSEKEKNKPAFYDIGIEFNKLSKNDENRMSKIISGLKKDA